VPTLLKKNSERRAGGCTQATLQNIFSAFLETSVKISLSLIVATVIGTLFLQMQKQLKENVSSER